MWPNPLETAKSTMKPTSGFERRTPRLFIWLDNHGLYESKIIADMKAKLGTCDGIFVLSISIMSQDFHTVNTCLIKVNNRNARK